jgi:iron complex outermembrane receptor protein
VKKILAALLVLFAHHVTGQTKVDSVNVLDEITIRAYEADRPLLQVPASVGLIFESDLARFSNTSLVSSVNNLPGIRMEERSPGSYRFSIRGSSLRSPFGVRNVKAYWNDLPLTDPGGNTYLNQLDANSIGQVEIIKGPGSSLYGAGTGGVLLMRSPQFKDRTNLSGGWTTGSYGLRSYQLAFNQGTENTSHSVSYQHQQADGYREQSRMVRDQLNSSFNFALSDKEKLETVIFYTDLYYQTPGGLNEAEYRANPGQARPAAGPQPSAVSQQAAVSLRSFYTGISHQYQFSKKLRNRTGVFGNFVQFENPSIRNFERRLEQNMGARSVTDYSFAIGNWNAKLFGGGEFLRGYSPVKNYQNKQGTPGTLQNDDEIRTLQYSVFGQGEFTKDDWIITAGLSANWVDYRLLRLTDLQPAAQETTYNPVLTPRIAVLRKINDVFSVHSNVSWGFSPPTLAEVRPSNGVFNTDLQSEKGIQVEVGARGYFLNRKFFVDAALYHFALDQTIVVRRDIDGADFFVNAGATNQNGAELLINWQPTVSTTSLSNFKLWSGLTFNYYTFKDYEKNNVSFSGNDLTGVPANVLTGGVDLAFKNGIYWYVTVNYTSSLPLNDANTVYADSFTLLGSKLGYKTWIIKNMPINIFVGADNLLDETYSLGNDLNAAAGRYFNAAAKRNYYAGIQFDLGLKREK